MATITLTGCEPFDGEYPFVFGDPPFNAGDLNIIKTISGVRSLELPEAFMAGDTDLIVALSVISVIRAGKADRKRASAVADVLFSAPPDGITFEPSAEDDALPPARKPSAAASESSASASGNDSSTGSETPESTPPGTGAPGSDTGSA